MSSCQSTLLRPQKGARSLLVAFDEGLRGTDLPAGSQCSPVADKPRCAVSRSHTPEWVENFVDQIGGEKAPAGSVGNKVSMLLLGEADIYVHKIGLKEWDTCAPEVIARALGWTVCKLRGDEHRYNQRDPYNNELVICRPAVKDRVIEVLAGCGALDDE